ncbi:MAG: site-specific integrase [Lachnospiraceae bacterium]|nr:site-specific integrase [Lachnospiraceae bacterium]
MGKSLTGRKLAKGVCQRKDGLYTARFTDRTGKKHEKYFHNPQEAKRWLDKEKLRVNYLDSMTTGFMTVDQWFQYWIENIKTPTVRYNTVRNYRERYQQNIGPVIGKMQISDVKTAHCQQVLNRMMDSYAGSTIERTRITMQSMFYYAFINEVISRSPMNKMVRVPKEIEKNVRFLTVEEQIKFMEAAKDCSNFGQYLLILQTGMRMGEVMGLQWQDIDFDNRQITVNRTMEFRYGEQDFRIGPPKSKSGHRSIPMTEVAYNLLKQRYDNREFRYVKEKRWEAFVFLNRKGRPTKNTAYDTTLEKICKKAKIKKISMHSLRHTYATRCIEAGMRPKTLQEILGHAHISTTMDLYVHNTEEEKKKEHQKFEAAFQECFKDIV